MVLTLINQGGAVDLRRAPAWALRGFSFLLFVLFYLLELSRSKPGGLPFPFHRQRIFHIASVIFIAFLGINIMTAIATYESITESLGFLSILVVMMLVSFYSQSKIRIEYIIHIVVAVGLFAAVHGLVMYFRNGASSPLDSFFAWHNPAGGYFAPILIIFIAWLFTNSPSRSLGRYGWMGAVIMSAALVFTLSRGAWLSFILAFITLIFLLGIKKAFNRTGLISFFAIVVLIVVLAAVIGGKSVLEPVYHRIVSISAVKDFSVEGRQNFYSGAIEIFKQAPFAGIGLGAYGFVYPRYQTNPLFYAKDPHSFYFRLLSEGGIAGLIIVLLILYCFFNVFAIYLRLREREKIPIAAGMIAAMTAGLLHLAIDFDDTFPLILLNLGLVYVCALNLLKPLESDAEQSAQTNGDFKRRRGIWKDVFVVLFFFLLIFHCGRMYLSESNYDTGKALSSEGMWAQAEKSFRLALDYNPMNDRALLERSRAMLFMHDQAMLSGKKETDDELLLEKAVALTQKLKNLAPYRATAYFLSGMALVRLDDYNKHLDAMRDFERALEIDPMNSPDFYLDACRTYLDVGNLKGFQKALEKFKTIYPFERVEEFTRTRIEWDNFPSIYQDMLLLETQILKFESKYAELIVTLSKMLELEKVRERVLGEAYEPRRELLDYVDKQTASIEDETSPKQDVESILEDIGGF